MIEDRWDVVVVGARCAGSATARRLAQQGLKVLVIDRATFPSDTVSTHAVAPHGIELLAQWGLLDDVLATGVPNPRTLGFRLGAVDLPTVPVPDGSHGTAAPRRTVLDGLLAEAARAVGAELWEATTAEALLRDGDRITGVRCRRADGAAVDVRASLVIGADGVRSWVGRAVGATTYDVRPSRLAGVYAYYAGTELQQNELGLVAGALGVAFPTNDGLAVIAVGADESRLREITTGGDDTVREIAERSSPRIGAALRGGVRATRYFTYRPTPNRFVTPFGPGWALVGDAGLSLDPITGQGIANAFLSAELIADAVVDGLGGAAPLLDRLEAYRQERDVLLAEVHSTTAWASSLRWTDDEIAGRFLELRAAVGRITASMRARRPEGAAV